MDINTDTACGRAKDPDMVLCCSSLDVIMTLGGSTGHSDKHGPIEQHGSWVPSGSCQLDAKTSGIQQPSAVTEAKDIDTDPSCCRATDAGMVLGRSSSSDIIMSPIASQAI